VNTRSLRLGREYGIRMNPDVRRYMLVGHGTACAKSLYCMERQRKDRGPRAKKSMWEWLTEWHEKATYLQSPLLPISASNIPNTSSASVLPPLDVSHNPSTDGEYAKAKASGMLYAPNWDGIHGWGSVCG